ncbi:MAG: recombination regulator RecX, partial [Myxococcota bacterium]
MRILARRAHGNAELSNKLRQRGFSTEDIDIALARAEELGFTESDEAIACRYAEELAQKSGATPKWVRHKLAARGLARDAI